MICIKRNLRHRFRHLRRSSDKLDQKPQPSSGVTRKGFFNNNNVCTFNNKKNYIKEFDIKILEV